MCMLSGELGLDQVEAFIEDGAQVTLRDTAAAQRSHDYLLEKVASGAVIYGVNTGFGSLHSTRINDADLEPSRSTSSGPTRAARGPPVDDSIVRLMLLLKIASLLAGAAACATETIERLLMHLRARCPSGGATSRAPSAPAATWPRSRTCACP